MVKTRSKVSKEDNWQKEYLFARPSDEEVKELKKNFEPTKPAPRKRQPKKRSL
jgi:hypothetical protein